MKWGTNNFGLLGKLAKVGDILVISSTSLLTLALGFVQLDGSLSFGMVSANSNFHEDCISL